MGTRRLTVDTPAPFRLDLTVWALRRRPHNTVDRWDGLTWRRSIMTADGAVELAVAQASAGSGLVVTLDGPGAPPSPAVVEEAGHLVTRVLGLGTDLNGFYALAARDGRLTALARRFVGMRPPRFPTVFEALVNAVACQQLSLDVGIHLLNRLASNVSSTGGGHGVPPPFPTPEQLLAADPAQLRALGFSGTKARTLITLAERTAGGEIDVEELDSRDDGDIAGLLVSLPGIGRWSAEYTLLRGLGRLEVLPGDDVGARNNLRHRFGLAADAGYDALSELSRDWWPYGGLVYFHLLLDRLAGEGHLDVPAGSEPRGLSSSPPTGQSGVA